MLQLERENPHATTREKPTHRNEAHATQRKIPHASTKIPRASTKIPRAATKITSTKIPRTTTKTKCSQQPPACTSTGHTTKEPTHRKYTSGNNLFAHYARLSSPSKVNQIIGEKSFLVCEFSTRICQTKGKF